MRLSKNAWLGLLVAVLSLNACFLIDDNPRTYSLQVINHCGGANYTVDFFMNGGFKGSVTYSRTFRGIERGTYLLEAVGTGSGGGYARQNLYINRDMQWVLCPDTTSSLATTAIDDLGAFEGGEKP